MKGFGVRLIAHDPMPSDVCKQLGVEYVELDELYSQSDIISLHCPLVPETNHLINEKNIWKMKTGVMLINTSRGAVIDAKDVINGLKAGKIGYLGLDVYEEEENLFFKDLSSKIIQDDIYARLETFTYVILTAHQAFCTEEALHNIFQTTVDNIVAFTKGKLINQV
mgnify:FL=1